MDARKNVVLQAELLCEKHSVLGLDLFRDYAVVVFVELPTW
jgi:hypothetical protein